MKRRHLIAAMAAASIALATATAPAGAQQKSVLKLGWTTSDGPQDPYAVGARAFKEEVERATGGSVEVRIAP